MNMRSGQRQFRHCLRYFRHSQFGSCSVTRLSQLSTQLSKTNVVSESTLAVQCQHALFSELPIRMPTCVAFQNFSCMCGTSRKLRYAEFSSRAAHALKIS
eukprot:TRINITY_DN115124_c0_g1_i1.p1 TRINITY_DN115124_c0_g1~~TRINITY_DN115124_c0_g1_i1.p1  ORF type:complete len:100 (-),score=7.23 TRINITY_DN115124_c0_g1_i1:85-384(-)